MFVRTGLKSHKQWEDGSNCKQLSLLQTVCPIRDGTILYITMYLNIAMSQAFDQGTALPCLSFVGTTLCLVGHHQEQVERQLTSPVLAEALRISGVPFREELICYNR